MSLMRIGELFFGGSCDCGGEEGVPGDLEFGDDVVGEVEGKGAGAVEDVMEVGLGDAEEAGEGAFGEVSGADSIADFGQQSFAQSMK